MGLSLALVIAALALPPPLPAPSEFATRVDNPWFPLRPGTVLLYRGRKDGAPSRERLAVLARTKTILGVRCTVVSDKIYVRGRIEERTRDWYAQDRLGNVWYLGEATAELNPNGSVRTREGSWQAGVDGARAGIFMPAIRMPLCLSLASRSSIRSLVRAMEDLRVEIRARTRS